MSDKCQNMFLNRAWWKSALIFFFSRTPSRKKRVSFFFFFSFYFISTNMEDIATTWWNFTDCSDMDKTGVHSPNLNDGQFSRPTFSLHQNRPSVMLRKSGKFLSTCSLSNYSCRKHAKIYRWYRTFLSLVYMASNRMICNFCYTN